MSTDKEACIYDGKDLAGTAERYKSLLSQDGCPHIAALELSAEKVVICAAMDSNCHLDYDRPSSPCFKPEGNLLRLFGVKGFDARNQELISVVPFYRSLNKSLLRFEGGTDVGSENVLHLEQRPLWIGPYFKNGPSSNRLSVRTQRTPEADFTRVPVIIALKIERESSYGRSMGVLRLGVAVEGDRTGVRPSTQEVSFDNTLPAAPRAAARLLESAGSPGGSVAVAEIVAEAAPEPEVKNTRPHSGSSLEAVSVDEQLQALAAAVRNDVRRLRELEDARSQNMLNSIELGLMINAAQESLLHHRLAFQALQHKATAAQAGTGWEVESQLQRIEEKIEVLQKTQDTLPAAVQAGVGEHIDRVYVQLSGSIESASKATGEALRAVQEGLGTDEDCKELLRVARELLTAVRQLRTPLEPDIQSKVDEAEAAIESTSLDVRHKLRLSIPLIPAVLTYITEFDVKAGLNILGLWEAAARRLRHR